MSSKKFWGDSWWILKTVPSSYGIRGNDRAICFHLAANLWCYKGHGVES